jgi:flagellar hook-basal body complex protein FliE
MPPITGISQIAGTTIEAAVKGTAKPGEFGSLLEASIENLEKPRTDANEAVSRLISGNGEELHSTLMAVQRAELTFELGLQVRNKIVQAYQEIMRMQI